MKAQKFLESLFVSYDELGRKQSPDKWHQSSFNFDKQSNKFLELESLKDFSEKPDEYNRIVNELRLAFLEFDRYPLESSEYDLRRFFAFSMYLFSTTR